LQTLWGKLFRRTPLPPVRLERWPTSDGDHVTLVHLEPTTDESPRVFLLHGLEGTAESHYVRGFLHQAAGRGWGVSVLLFRTCDGSPNLARRTYHSGEIEDPRAVLSALIRKTPNVPWAAVGVSLGANVLLRLLATSSEFNHSLVAAVAISTPFDLARSCRHLQKGFSRLYQWHFVRKLRAKAFAKIDQHPDLADRAKVRSARTLWAFDDAFTSVVHGFRDAGDYYAQCSSLPVLERIGVPTLLLSSRDDPFYPGDLLDDVERASRCNPTLSIEFHDRGGHVGFIGGSPARPLYYAEVRAAEFIGARVPH
jgi:uncharacterized protein